MHYELARSIHCFTHASNNFNKVTICYRKVIKSSSNVLPYFFWYFSFLFLKNLFGRTPKCVKNILAKNAGQRKAPNGQKSPDGP